MSTVFLDTVGLLALWDVSDQWHVAAELAYQRLIARQVNFTTSSFILLECGNAAARRPYRDEVDSLRRLLEQRGELIFPTPHDWTVAWEAYARGEGSRAGIVDQISFGLMRRLKITEAFTNDQHFLAAAFQPLF